MDFGLSEQDRAVQAEVRAFVDEHIRPHARKSDEDGYFDVTRVKQLGDAGLLGGPLDRAWGSRGWTHVQWALALMELGAADSSWRGFCTVQTCLCGLLIERFGTVKQQQDLLCKLVSGEWIFSYALTEPEAGTDVAAIQTTATSDGADVLISGTKQWITNGGVADRILVFANADPEQGRDGITCFVVPGDAPGLTREPVEGKELGHRGSNHAVLRFDEVRLPATSVVGGLGKGFEVAMGGLEDGRLGVASGAVGIQQACVDACLEFARSRRQFGRRIGDFQLIQQDLADMWVGLDSSRLLTLQAAWKRDRGESNASEVSVAKYAACEAAVTAADRAVLLHGARGYSSAWPVERYLRDAKGLQIYEGTSHIQRIIIARDLLGKEAR